MYENMIKVKVRIPLKRWENVMSTNLRRYMKGCQLTLKMRYILVTLRPTKEHWTRPNIQVFVNFKTAIISGGGCENSRKQNAFAT